jgi:acetyl-CoA acyltransferase
MPDAVIVSALRTPIGTATKDTLRDTDAYQLAEHVIGAGGVNSASTSPRFKRRAGSHKDAEMVDWFPPTHPNRPDAPNIDMSITVGWNAAVKAGVSREEMDEWALGSHRKAIQAIDEGRFKHEIVPIETPHGMFEVDEHPRRDTTIEKLATLKWLHPEIEGFSITAGNACGAVEAVPKALARAWLSLADVDLFEINEAFASMCVATVKLLDIDPDKVNVSGSGCSLGHPVAATGARMLVTLVHELRRRGGGIGVAAMCAGGGMGSTTVIEVPAP